MNKIKWKEVFRAGSWILVALAAFAIYICGGVLLGTWGTGR